MPKTSAEQVAENMKRIDAWYRPDRISEPLSSRNQAALEEIYAKGVELNKKKAEAAADRLNALKKGVPPSPSTVKEMLRQDLDAKLDAELDAFNEPHQHRGYGGKHRRKTRGKFNRKKGTRMRKRITHKK